MDEQITWGLLLREWRKTRLDMKTAEMVNDFSIWRGRLSDEQLVGLLQLGVDPTFTLTYDTLNNFETDPDKVPTNRERGKILCLICYFRTRGLLQPEEANRWLDLAGLAQLRPYERERLFGNEETWMINAPRFRKTNSFVAYVSNQLDRVVIENPRLNAVSEVIIRFVDSPMVPLILLVLLITLLFNAPRIIKTLHNLFDHPTPTPTVIVVPPLPTAIPTVEANVTPSPTITSTAVVSTSALSINAGAMPSTTLPVGTHSFEGTNAPGTHVEILVNGSQGFYMSEMPTEGSWSIDVPFTRAGEYGLDVIEVSNDGEIMRSLDRFTVTVSSSIPATISPTESPSTFASRLPVLSNDILQPIAAVVVLTDHLTLSETNFISEVNKITEDVNQNVAILEELLERERDNPGQFTDSEWQTELRNVAKKFGEIAALANRLPVPETLRMATKTLSAAASATDLVASSLLDAVQQSESNKLSEAKLHLSFVHAHFSSTVRIIETEIGFINSGR